MPVDVYTPFPFNNVALVAWGRFGPSKKTSPFGLDDAVLKSTLYLGKGVLYVAWLFSFLSGDVFFANTGQGCLVFDTIASAGFVVDDRGCENAWPGQRIIANCLNYHSFPERRCENAWPGQRIVFELPKFP
jgi:hypothetical protein